MEPLSTAFRCPHGWLLDKFGKKIPFFLGRVDGKEKAEGVEGWIFSKLIEGRFQS